MKTIICKFKSEGKNIKKRAILNDTLEELSKSKKNEAYDIMEYDGERFWSILFEEEKNIYEIEFKYDTENEKKTLKPIKAITWGGNDGSVVTDAQSVQITVK